MMQGPLLLQPDHVLEGFDCGDSALDAWLTKRARNNHHDGNSRTWVVIDDERRVIAFYASSACSVWHSDASGRMKRNSPDPLPALLIGRLAVDSKYQGHQIGPALLKHFILKSLEVAEITGVRVLLAHAASQPVTHFYRKWGFESSPIDDLTMMLLIKDVRG